MMEKTAVESIDLRVLTYDTFLMADACGVNLEQVPKAVTIVVNDKMNPEWNKGLGNTPYKYEKTLGSLSSPSDH